MTMGLAIVDAASVARIALVGIGVGGTLTLSRLAEQADSSWGGITLDIVDRPENLGRGSAFGSDSAAAAVNTSQHRLEALSPSLHSFRSWLDESGSPSTDLDEMPMSRSVYGDYLAATLAKAIDRLRDCGVRVRFYPMHATSVRPQAMGWLYSAIPPNCRRPTSRLLLPVCGLPLRPRSHTTSSRPTPSVACGLASAISVRSRFSAAVSPPWMSLARSTTARRASTCSPEAAPCPGFRSRPPRNACARTSHRGCGHISCGLERAHSGVGACAARSRTRSFRILQVRRSLVMSPTPTHWSDPLADPADLACHHTLSATNHALNTAFTLLPEPERILLRESLGSKWFRYRVRVPLSRWRQLRAMQVDGRLVVHGGVDAREGGLDDILADLGTDRVIPAVGQSSNLWEGPELVADLAASGLVDCDDAGQGLVDPATCRALTPGGGPRDDLLLVGQVSAGSYFTVSALDVVVGQARRAAQTIADAITTRTQPPCAGGK